MSVVLRLDHGAGRVSLPLNRRSRVRDRIAAEIERLVDMLDAIDGDADAEPDLGWPEVDGVNPLPRPAIGFSLDPSSVKAHALIRTHGAKDDREDDAGDDREPDEDWEPILGWTDAENQTDLDRFGDAWRHDEDEESVASKSVTRRKG